jgi:four helix bundle protein
MTTGRGLWAGRPGATCGLFLRAELCRRGQDSDVGVPRRLAQSACVSDFRKLHVWQKALALSLSVDRVCKKIRGAQYASLRSQLFRAATSIPANIAEGRRQESEKEFARFLRYALNSSSELESHLILARGCEAISEADFRSLVSQTIRVRKMLYALLKSLSVNDPPAPVRAHKTARPKPPAGPPTAPGR